MNACLVFIYRAQLSEKMFSILCFMIFVHQVLSKSPELVPLAKNLVVEKNQEFSLVCSILRGSQPIKIQWFKNGVLLRPRNDLSIVSQQSLSVLTFSKVQTNDSANYSCVASNSDGSNRNYTFLQVKGKIVSFGKSFFPNDITYNPVREVALSS